MTDTTPPLPPTEPAEPTSPTPSALDELMAWKVKHGVDLLIVAVSPWGKTAPIVFLLPDGFGAEVQVVRQVENGLQP